jgi:Ca-activated chloride channel family protein
VTYGSNVDTKLGLTSGESLARVHDAIDDLHEAGSTNMEAGMRRAYEIATSALGSTEQVRVVLFTDTQPNVGATAPSDFESIVIGASEKDIHTTTLALGLGIGPEVLRAMASMRGANAYSLTSTEEVDTFMENDYPWFTTPIAFSLRVNASLGAGWSIDRGLGFPAASDGQQVGLKAETVFLSKRKGAMLVALTPPAGTPAGLSGSFSLAYDEPDGTPVDEVLPFSYDGTPLDERGQWFGQHGVARTTALGLLVEGMHGAAKLYSQDPVAAETVMRAAATRFAADAESLGDTDLPIEVELSAAMLRLIVERAPQGTLYGP